MILYFSATGNCQYVANRLAKGLKEQAASMVDCIREGRYAFSDSVIGFVSPTYDWGLPSVVKEFLEEITVSADYLFFVSTYGTTTGASGYMARKALHGRKMDAFYSVRMADTWTPVFDLSTPEKVAVFTKNTEKEIDDAIAGIQARWKKRRMSPRVPFWMGTLFAQPFYNAHVRKTAHFRVEDSCIGCGLCAKKCPVQAIHMEDRRPVWGKEKCAMCLGCLHRCPRFAIQYGKNTRKHGQYVNPHVRE